MVQIAFSGVRCLPVITTLLVVAASGISYCFAVAKQQVPAFIPFIRHSAAYPPQSGIFTIFITISGFFGVLTFVLRYVVVKNRSFHVEHRRYEKLNEASLYASFLFIAFLIYTSINALGFEKNSKDAWISNVLVPHHVGALSMCLCFDMYVFIQAYMTYQQKRSHKSNVFIHAVLATCAVVSTWTAVIPIASSLKDEIKSLKEGENGLVGFEYKQYNFYSTICALSEWSFVFFSLMFIFSFVNDFKKMSVRFQVRPKRVVSDSVELPTLRSHGNNKTTSIPEE